MLKLNHVTKTFNPGTVNAKTALDDVSLHINRGDFVSIIGANGAGKSTIMGAIAGEFFTDTGSIILDGEDITLKPERKRVKVIGRLFQDMGIQDPLPCVFASSRAPRPPSLARTFCQPEPLCARKALAGAAPK